MKDFTSSYYSTDQDIHFTMTTPEEEKALFIAARGGCEKSRTFLIHNHLLFAAMQAQSIVKGRLPNDEVVSAANYAVMKAFQSFNPGLGFRFTTYLRPFIQGEVSALWKSKFSCGMADPSISGGPADSGHSCRFLNNDRVNELSEASIVEELDLTRFNKDRIMAAISKLSERDAALIEMKYVQGLSFAEIGRRRGTTREAVRMSHLHILARLRRLLKSK